MGIKFLRLAYILIHLVQILVFFIHRGGETQLQVGENFTYLGLIYQFGALTKCITTLQRATQTCNIHKKKKNQRTEASLLRYHKTLYTALQSQKAVTGYLKSKQLLPFGFARQSMYDCRVKANQKINRW